jgi:hypothetical protein
MTTMSLRLAAPVLVIVLALSPPSLFAAAPAGSEFQINSFTIGGQRNPAVTCRTTNDFAVAWDGADTGDGTTSTIFARRSNAAAGALGPLYEAVSESCSGQTCEPRPSFDATICRDAEGDFVIAWERAYGGDGDGSAVVAQRFDSAGAPRGAEFQVNTYTRGYQYAPAVGCRASGEFTVVWQQEEGGQTGVFGRRFGSSGTPLGGDFRVDSTTSYYVSSARIAVSDGGGFVVVWTSTGYFSSPDGSGPAVVARRFDSSGSAQGAEFRVNDFTAGYQQNPDVAALAAEFVVVWESGDLYDTQDGGYAGIFARRLGAAGLLGAEFQVNSYTPEYQQRPAVAAAAAGAFVVAWQSGDYYGSQDGSYAGIFARRYDGAGVPGPEFQVSVYTLGDQAYPSLCADDLGNFLVVWDSLGQDGSSTGLFARRHAVHDVSGHLRYYRDDRPVPGALVDLAGEPVPDALTSASGGFAFAEAAEEPRTLRPRRLGGAEQGVSSLDAAWVSQERVGLRTFDAFQALACDVTGNGTISSLDAAQIKQLKLGIIDRFVVAENCGSDWAFVPNPAAAANQSPAQPLITTGACQPGAIAFTPLDPPAADQDFVGVLFGDCTGNWTP